MQEQKVGLYYTNTVYRTGLSDCRKVGDKYRITNRHGVTVDLDRDEAVVTWFSLKVALEK